MNLEDLVLTVEQARHLQELGLDMEGAALYWGISRVTGNIFLGRFFRKENEPPTYTLQEILAKLPERILIEGNRYYKHIDDVDCRVWYESANVPDFVPQEYGETLLDAAYKMLCRVIENGYLKTKEL